MMQKAKEAFERLYDAKMNVETYTTYKEGNVTMQGWQVTLTDVPCRISKKNLASVNEANGPLIAYEIRLYCAPEVDVPAGSRVTVTDQHGHARMYKATSEAFNSYFTHQEIAVVREDKA